MERSDCSLKWNDLSSLQKAEIISSPYFSKLMEKYKLSLKTTIKCLFITNPEMVISDAGDKSYICFNTKKIENVFINILLIFIEQKEKELP